MLAGYRASSSQETPDMKKSEKTAQEILTDLKNHDLNDAITIAQLFQRITDALDEAQERGRKEEAKRGVYSPVED